MSVRGGGLVERALEVQRVDDPAQACPEDPPPAEYSDRDRIPETHRRNVDCMTHRGPIVLGYVDGTYRPTLPVPRDQMASFVARTLEEAGFEVRTPRNPKHRGGTGGPADIANKRKLMYPPDLVFADAIAAVSGWEFVAPPHYRGGCLITVPLGVLPCTDAVWRRVTFTNPDVTMSVPASWQVGVDAVGIRLSSAVEHAAATDAGCSLSGIPLMSATGDDVILHLRMLEDSTGLPPRPEDFAYNNIQRFVRGPACAAARHLIEYDLAFEDEGQGFLIIRIASDEGPPAAAHDIMNSLAVGH